MYRETDLIPYKASDIPPGPWLVFAPHPDDEGFGMGGAIALASNAGIRVEVVVMTGGEGAGDPEIRRKESLRAGEILGVGRHHFWSLPDRGVSQAVVNPDELRAVLDSLKPETVFLPGIQEYHPDHRAATRIIWAMLKRIGFIGSVWLYEISRQNEANRLVDITSVVELKQKAMKCFFSQLAQIDYERMVLGINSSRAYSLNQHVTHAEAFWSCAENQDPIMSQYNALYRYRMNPGGDDSALVSVVVRTRNRRKLLTEAIESIARQSYRPVEVIVVNDAGDSLPVEDIRGIIPDMTLKYIEHETNQGRAAAANSGIREAAGDFVCFLDDDDLFYPQALETLLFQADQGRITHAMSKCLTYGPTGDPDPESEEVLGEPVDRGRLILENYIPFNTVCIPRTILEKIGPLDETLEIYEDWDLMIRLSKTWEMQFINALVSEYRIFGSATYTGKGGADKQHNYRKKVLAKHQADVSAGDILRFVQKSVDRVVLEKERMINLLRDDVTRKRLELDSKESDIIKQSEFLRELESEIDHHKSAIDHHKSEIDHHKSEIDHLRRMINSKDENIALLESHLNAVFSSTSWKLTKPLRVIKNMTGFNK
jgi:LmbE family N-acetylglucosaminyl deacetylase/glycosyltransferase involved in cell wall biosynthesis